MIDLRLPLDLSPPRREKMAVPSGGVLPKLVGVRHLEVQALDANFLVVGHHSFSVAGPRWAPAARKLDLPNASSGGPPCRTRFAHPSKPLRGTSGGSSQPSSPSTPSARRRLRDRDTPRPPYRLLIWSPSCTRRTCAPMCPIPRTSRTTGSSCRRVTRRRSYTRR